VEIQTPNLCVVEEVDGRVYAEYVREEILDPLGMERTTFHEADVAGDDAATGSSPRPGSSRGSSG